jgi:hypothetical protein
VRQVVPCAPHPDVRSHATKSKRQGRRCSATPKSKSSMGNMMWQRTDKKNIYFVEQKEKTFNTEKLLKLQLLLLLQCQNPNN